MAGDLYVGGAARLLNCGTRAYAQGLYDTGWLDPKPYMSWCTGQILGEDGQTMSKSVATWSSETDRPTEPTRTASSVPAHRGYEAVGTKA